MLKRSSVKGLFRQTTLQPIGLSPFVSKDFSTRCSSQVCTPFLVLLRLDLRIYRLFEINEIYGNNFARTTLPKHIH